MKAQRIYYECLGLLINVVMLILLFSCGKPVKDKKEAIEKPKPQVGRTEMQEELESISNESPKVEKRLHQKTKGLSIRIIPRKVLKPFEEFDRISRPNCGRGNWDSNDVQYDRSKVSWKNYSDDFSQLLRNDMIFRATSPSGTNINSGLDELIKSKAAIVSTKPSFIEIKLPSKDWPNSLTGTDELDIELSLTPSKIAIDIGSLREVRRNCVRSRPEPSRGVDGAARGGLKGSESSDFKSSQITYFEGFGFTSQVYEVQYELDIRLVSSF